MSDEADPFRPLRETVRHLQKRLVDQEAEYSYICDKLERDTAEGRMNWTTYSALMANERHKIGMIETEIVKFKSRLPPHAEYRDGILFLEPVWEPIDPRALLIPEDTSNGK